MERLRSQMALAAFLQEVGEAVEQAELVMLPNNFSHAANVIIIFWES